MEKAILRILCLSFLLLNTAAYSQGNNNINGQVTYHDNFPIAGVTAYLHNSNDDIIDSSITNISGHYNFQNVSPGNYSITFSTDQPAGGVTLTDAYLVMLHLLNLYPFTPIQELASDVDGSGNVTWTDYILILIGYLNQGNPFPIGPWVFEQLDNVTIPAGAREGFTTRGGSSGDVNGSLVPDPKISPIFLINPVMNLATGISDPIEFKLASAGNAAIAGMHLVLKIPEGLNVLSVESPISTASISILDNQVRVTWIDQSRHSVELTDGMSILVITATATDVSRNGNNFSLKLTDESHFIDSDGKLMSGINLTLPTINMVTTNDLGLTVYPNPFMEYAILDYMVPEDGKVIILLFDQAGRMVQEIANGDCSAGIRQVKINGADLIPGIYHYSIMFTGSDRYINTGTIIRSK